MLLGVDYYPEQWDPSLMDADLDNIVELGSNVIRIADFAGVTVVETESLQQGQEFALVGTDGSVGEGSIFRDFLETDGAEVLYRYGDAFYTKFPAVTRKKQGKGWIYYLGCGLDSATYAKITNGILDDAGVAVEKTADGVEIRYRGEDSSRVRIVMNHNPFPVTEGAYKLAPFESYIEPV